MFWGPVLIHSRYMLTHRRFVRLLKSPTLQSSRSILPVCSWNLNRFPVTSTCVLQIEVSTGKFPYSQWDTPFEQLRQVVQDDPPKLPNDKFSAEFVYFVDSW